MLYNNIRKERKRKMRKRVSEEDKALFVELYEQLGTYSAVAREVGFSASTVRKYVLERQKDGVSARSPETMKKVEIKLFTEENLKKVHSYDNIKSVEELFSTTEDWGTLCELSQEEKKEIENLRKEKKL
jgi:transposase-like protein